MPLLGHSCSKAMSLGNAPLKLPYLLAHSSNRGVFYHSRIWSPYVSPEWCPHLHLTPEFISIEALSLIWDIYNMKRVSLEWMCGFEFRLGVLLGLVEWGNVIYWVIRLMRFLGFCLSLVFRDHGARLGTWVVRFELGVCLWRGRV